MTYDNVMMIMQDEESTGLVGWLFVGLDRDIGVYHKVYSTGTIKPNKSNNDTISRPSTINERRHWLQSNDGNGPTMARFLGWIVVE